MSYSQGTGTKNLTQIRVVIIERVGDIDSIAKACAYYTVDVLALMASVNSS